MSSRPLLVGLLVGFLGLPSVVTGQTDVPIDLSGTWAELQVYSELSTIPFLNANVTRTSTVLLRTEITQTGSSLALRQTYCSTQIDSGTFLVSTVIPDGFLVALGEIERRATLDGSGATIRFTQDWYSEARGCRLTDPDRDALPTSLEDSRVFDQDGDGHPGLTVRVSILGVAAGEVYVVQRVHYRLAGLVVTPERIEGLIEWANEQVTLAATSSFLAADTKSRPDPVVDRSFFVLRRIDPEVGCQGIATAGRAAFGR